jgi:type IV secretion system protein VirB10
MTDRSTPPPGDRGVTLVRRAASLQARLGNVLAIALIAALGVAAMIWYYAHAIPDRRPAARPGPVAAAAATASAESPMPSIGRIDPPVLAVAATSVPEPLDPGPSVPAGAAPPAMSEAIASSESVNGANVPAKTPLQQREERELSGAVFVPQARAQTIVEEGRAEPVSASSNRPGTAVPGDLGALLTSSAGASVRPQTLPTRRLLLPKGAFIDCTLETAIDSSLPGLVTCVMATDAFGADGSVVLLERGTKLLGETRGQVQQGSARVFVLWTEARTPTGVVVPLGSPGADELGRSGLPGEVNRHFWQRFGAALLISVIDGATEGAVAGAGGGSGAVIINPGAAQGVTTEVLRSTVGIAPTVTKRNGERIQVIVARDVDFRSVYELRPAP